MLSLGEAAELVNRRIKYELLGYVAHEIKLVSRKHFSPSQPLTGRTLMNGIIGMTDLFLESELNTVQVATRELVTQPKACAVAAIDH